MKLTPLIISLLMITGVILGLGSFHISLFATYGGLTDNNITGTNFTEFNKTFSNFQALSGDIQGSVLSGDKGATTAVQDSIIIFWDTMTFVAKVPNFIIDYMTLAIGMVTGIEIPSWFVAIMTSVLLVYVAMTIVAVVLKRDEL